MVEGSQTVAITVPLLFLLITQFSSIARDMELAEVAGKQPSPLVFPFLDELSIPMCGEVDFFPAFGRFNFLHGINTVIVGLVLLLAVNLLSGTLKWVIVTIAFLVWLILPTLEVEEYDKRLNDDSVSGLVGESLPLLPNWWHSLHTHSVCVIITTAIGILTVSFFPPDQILHAGLVVKIVIVVAFFVSAFLTYLLPLHDLQRELVKVDTDNGTESC